MRYTPILLLVSIYWLKATIKCLIDLNTCTPRKQLPKTLTEFVEEFFYFTNANVPFPKIVIRHNIFIFSFSWHHQQSFLAVLKILYVEDVEMCNLFVYTYPSESPAALLSINFITWIFVEA